MLTCSLDTPSGIYSILIRATFLVIVEDLMLNAKDDAKKHSTNTSVKNNLEDDMLMI